ncbi:hypothetical protein IAQ61_009182 [Plenodomus lingam]|uniref:uncharacterized protein n=1 Tax=Leptosphaeria maculans TaxID=5022 RepID=UPI00331D9E58|nr:hypothetical protein IAQ61_009182 [Plenodomus lingam]
MSQKNSTAIHIDSPLLPTSSSTLPPKSSCIAETTPLQPRFPTFLDSPSPPPSPETPSQTYPPTFLLSPSLLSESSDSPLLSKHTSSTPTTPSDFGGAYPTPRTNLLSLYSPSTALPRLSWYSSFSTASTCIETNAAYTTQQLNEILPDDMDFYSEDIEGYGLGYEPNAMSDAAWMEPRGLGLELPFIAERDFAYYPNLRARSTEMAVQAEVFGDVEDNDVPVKEKKGGVRGVVGRLVRKGLRKIRVGKFT